MLSYFVGENMKKDMQIIKSKKIQINVPESLNDFFEGLSKEMARKIFIYLIDYGKASFSELKKVLDEESTPLSKQLKKKVVSKKNEYFRCLKFGAKKLLMNFPQTDRGGRNPFILAAAIIIASDILLYCMTLIGSGQNLPTLPK